MGNLKPGIKYIYERQGGTVYAREFGADPSTRVEIGFDWEVNNNPSSTKGSKWEQIKENQLWSDIRQAATTNTALQEELDRIKMLYYLIKEETNGQIKP